MVAALTTHQSFYKDTISYQLQAAVAQAGGNEAQRLLFSFLLEPSMCVTEKDRSFSLHDCRAGESLTLLFPPRFQILLSILFYYQELETYKSFNEQYNLISNIKTPREICLLQQSITGNQIGSCFLSYLNQEKPLDKKALKFLFDLNDPSVLTGSNALGDRLRNLFDYYQLTYSFLDQFIDVATSNDRHTAAVYLAERFNYSMSYIQVMANTAELWLLQNSYI